MFTPSPIILFVYNRPNHTKIVLDALAENPEAKISDLYIVSDFYKDEDNRSNVLLVREIISNEKRFNNVNIILNPKNFGLATSIINGVSYVLNIYETIIVLEDDLIPSIGFLKYMNDALEFYKNNDEVGCIHAWNYTFDNPIYNDDTFFLLGADCWGWATWRKYWLLFELNGNKLLEKIDSRNLKFKFNRNGTQDFYNMLVDQINGKNNSWAIRWHASLFLENKLCLHPKLPLVENIGFDGTGQHCNIKELYKQNTVNYITVKKIPIIESKWFFNKYKIYLLKKKFEKFSIFNKIKNRMFGFKQWKVTDSNWEEANIESSGYDQVKILNKCKNALLKVKNGLFSFERDSVLFNKPEYSWHLLTLIFQHSILNNNKVSLIDYGGSLGTTYFQNVKFLSTISNLKWYIVEQDLFSQCGKKYFENETIKFFNNIEDVFKIDTPKIIYLGCVIQYLKEPKTLISKIINFNFDYIIFERIAFINENSDILTIQNVDKNIYDASYPAWFFNKNNFISHFNDYDIVSILPSYIDKNISIKNKNAYWETIIFKKL